MYDNHGNCFVPEYNCTLDYKNGGKLPIHDFSVTVISGPSFGSRIALNPRTAPTDIPPKPPIASAAKI